ncbi:hypothetical protein PENSOL_c033G08721 [Penicillium solitum]|uniref:Uncharacterized protein n=1 Tax=Penicillium solitum TaxID=60172 RepID=A0A1V6QWQ6_9EURO|nr:uncharacterized protein PENSOL_c033G08721 [Penicillium solitum]OQD93402.1 hypothetical protein PENSOL_c033G08721 [Penicillium solitum]
MEAGVFREFEESDGPVVVGMAERADPKIVGHIMAWLSVSFPFKPEVAHDA